MNIEQIEQTCAETLLGYAQTMAEAYTNEPEDFSATIVALLARTLELHLNRPINLENLLPKNQSLLFYKMALLPLTKWKT